MGPRSTSFLSAARYVGLVVVSGVALAALGVFAVYLTSQSRLGALQNDAQTTVDRLFLYDLPRSLKEARRRQADDAKLPPDVSLPRAITSAPQSRGSGRLPYRLIICGLAHNNALQIEYFTRPLMEATAAHFIDTRFVFYENDSSDGTGEYLLRWAAAEDRVHVVSERLGEQSAIVFGGGSETRRYQMLAWYRNRYLRVIRESYSDWDLMLVVDTDIAVWSVQSLVDLLTNFPPSTAAAFADAEGPPSVPLPSWHAVCAQGVTRFPVRYYDTLAHRDVWDRYHFHQTDFWKGRDAMHVTERHFGDVEDSPAYLEPVRSCFGGIMLYYLPAVVERDCWYKGDTDCEHTSFHTCLGRIRYYPHWKCAHH